jgi:hypothetical protein
VQLNYMLPVNLTGRVDVELTQRVGLFAAYLSTTSAFFIEDTANDRLFYRTRSAQGGVSVATKLGTFEAGIGYALEREFERGDTIDSTKTVTDLSEEPFAFLSIKGTF